MTMVVYDAVATTKAVVVSDVHMIVRFLGAVSQAKHLFFFPAKLSSTDC